MEELKELNEKSHNFLGISSKWVRDKLFPDYDKDKQAKQLFYNDKLFTIVEDLEAYADCPDSNIKHKKNYIELVSVISHTSNSYKASKWALVTALASVLLSIVTIFTFFMTKSQLKQITRQTTIQSHQLITEAFDEAMSNMSGKVEIVNTNNIDQKGKAEFKYTDNKKIMNFELNSKLAETDIIVSFEGISRKYIRLVKMSIIFKNKQDKGKVYKEIEDINSCYIKNKIIKSNCTAPETKNIGDEIRKNLQNENLQQSMSNYVFIIQMELDENAYIEEIMNRQNKALNSIL